MSTKIFNTSTITDQLNKRIRFESKVLLDQENPIIEKGALVVVVDPEGNNYLIIGRGDEYLNTPILIVDREEEIKDLNNKITDIVKLLRNFNNILFVIWTIIVLLFILVILILVFK